MSVKKIKLETSHGIPLNTYYKMQPGLFGCFKIDIDANKWKFTPYETCETIYYLCKHLALPGIAGIFFPFIVFFRIFDNFIIGSIGYFITVLVIVLLLSVGREFLRGLIYRFKGDFIYLPGPYYFRRQAESYEVCINKIDEPIYKIGFVGDIMMMKKFELEFHPDIKAFFKDVQVIVGNLEGIISEDSRFLAKQAHTEKILDQLESILSRNTKWLLCLSNNHSEDYGNLQFNKTLRRIQARPKFDVFGREDVSFIHNHNHDINIFSPTQWSNQKTWNYTYKYHNPGYVTKLIDNKKFNMLYLHWGYENEKYVRSRFKKDAGALLTAAQHKYRLAQRAIRNKSNRVISPDFAHKWDFIFAHHPHVLQPIMKFSDLIVNKKGKIIYDKKKNPYEYDKLAVFSAGNFTSGANIIRKKKHISGIIMKCEIGPLKNYNEKLAIGKMEWRRTKNHKIRVKKELKKRVCVDNEKYRTYNRPFFIAGIFYFLLILAVFYFR